MKVALVHELLTMKGGAERVLRVLAAAFPEAPIYTLLYDKNRMSDWFPAERVRPSRLQKFAGISKNHHLYLPFFPGAVEAWDFSKYDLVISSSSAFAHGIKTRPTTKHISFVNAPARYLWDRTFDVQDRAAESGAFGPLKRRYLQRTFHKLRQWDADAADRADRILTSSQFVGRRVELYWREHSHVLYPPLDDFWLQEGPYTGKRDNYCLVVSTLAPYKRIDLAIDACTQAGLPLKIVGQGPALENLKKRAGANVEFLGYQPKDQVANLYRHARTVLFPGDEDFGLVPLEAMSCGTPVVAYRSGGALETIVEGETGLFFSQPTADSLAETLQKAETHTFDPIRCRTQAEQFTKERFLKQLHQHIAEVRA